jgi:hypothetical protein
MCNLETLPRLRRAKGELNGSYVLETASFLGHKCYHVNKYEKGELLQTGYIDKFTKELFFKFGDWLASVRYGAQKKPKRSMSFQELDNRIHQRDMTKEEEKVTSYFVATNPLPAEKMLRFERVFPREGAHEVKNDDDDDDVQLPFAININYFSADNRSRGLEVKEVDFDEEDCIFGKPSGIASEAIIKKYGKIVKERVVDQEPFLL